MKKRILLFALLIITITCLAAVTVSAATYRGTCGANSSDLTWSLDTDTGVLNITGTGPMKNWNWNSYAPWDSYRSYIKSVDIGNSVTSIGSFAFYYCDSLTSVDIGDSVTSIGDYAIDNCRSLTRITVDKANTKYSSDEYGVLFNKDKTTLIHYPRRNTRTSYTIPDSVTSIGSNAFCGCDSLTSVVIPDGVTSIGSYAFSYGPSLTSVVIPDSVTSIGSNAFSGCDNLTIYVYSGSYAETYAKERNKKYAVLAENCGDNLDFNYDVNTGTLQITGIGDMYNWSSSSYVPWYSYLSNIKSVTIDDGVTSIGDYAFAYCDSLTSVDIGNSVTSIGDDAFCDCDSLTSIAVDEANTKYSSDEYGVLFNENKTTLIQYPIGNTRTSYTIPDSVTSINSSAFRNCTSLTSITVDKANTKYSSDEYGVLFNKDKTTLIQYPIGNTRTSYTIPDSVTSIGYHAFLACDSLTSVVIPDSVTSIDGSAFADCDNLTIYVYSGSYAETYANDNDIPFAIYEEPAVIPGDVNSDDKVDRKDLTRLAQYFARWDAEVDTDAADANGDGKVDRKDITRLAQYFARWDVVIGETRYTITYNANEGTNAPSSQVKTNKTDLKLSSVIPIKDGYIFCGWLCIDNGKTYNAGDTFELNSNAELYALWGEECSDCNGEGVHSSKRTCGYCSGTGEVKEQYAVQVTCVICNGTGKGSVCSSCQGLGGITKCICVCGNSWVLSNGADMVCDRCGTRVNATTVANCTWCNGSGLGRCTICGGSGKNYEPHTRYTTCSYCNGIGTVINTTVCTTCDGIKAKIIYNDYNVTLNDGNSTIKTTSVTVNSSYSFPVPTKNGYTFIGWFDAINGGKQYTDNSGNSLSVWLDFSDKILYAHWK